MDKLYYYVRQMDTTIKSSKTVLNSLEKKICGVLGDDSIIASKMMSYFLQSDKDQNALENTIVREDMFGLNIN
jgi:hypothetical protein